MLKIQEFLASDVSCCRVFFFYTNINLLALVSCLLLTNIVMYKRTNSIKRSEAWKLLYFTH